MSSFQVEKYISTSHSLDKNKQSMIKIDKINENNEKTTSEKNALNMPQKESLLNMNMKDVAHLATIIGVIIALLVYITNSLSQARTRKIENIKRFLDMHDRLFEDDGYIVVNIKEMEDGTYKRDQSNKEMEVKFNRLLGDIERIALLTNNKAISKTIQTYMFGWFAQRIQPQLTSEERNNIFWELAVKYLDEMKQEADDYEKKDGQERRRYWEKRHFSH
jgi:hypothetical protein